MLVSLPTDKLDVWHYNFKKFFENKVLPSNYSTCPTCSADLTNKTNLENNYNDGSAMKDIEFSTMSTLQMENDTYSSNLIDTNFTCYGDHSSNKIINDTLDEG